MARFDWAMEKILDGTRVRRKDWNRPAAVYSEIIKIGIKHFRTIVMEMRDGTINAYSPSQCDMTASDWCVAITGDNHE